MGSEKQRRLHKGISEMPSKSELLARWLPSSDATRLLGERRAAHS